MGNRRNLTLNTASARPAPAELQEQAPAEEVDPKDIDPIKRIFDMFEQQAHNMAAAKASEVTDWSDRAFKSSNTGIDLRALFDKYDADESGAIDREEFAAAVTEMGVELSDSDVDAVFAKFDRDGSGVDYGEFSTSYYNRRKLCKEAEETKQLLLEVPDVQQSLNNQAAAAKARRIARDPTYVVKVTKPVFVKTYDSSPMGIFEQAMDKIRDKATDPTGKKINLKKIFEEFDEDGGGTIDKQELESALYRFDARLSQIELDTVYSMFDRDGGGIEYGEFCWCFYNRRVLATGNAAWANEGAEATYTKKEKSLVGDARFRHWLDKDMAKQAEKRNKAAKIAVQQKELRQQADKQRMLRRKQGLSSPSAKTSPSKREWVPASGSLNAPREHGYPYNDKYLVNPESPARLRHTAEVRESERQ